MTPEPAQPLPPNPGNPMAPPYVDEDVNETAVEQGLAAAENELRDTVAETYEEGARHSADPDEMMDDIDYTEAEDEETVADLPAMEQESKGTTDDTDEHRS